MQDLDGHLRLVVLTFVSDFAFKIECTAFVDDVGRGDEHGEAELEHKRVDDEERTIVEEGAGP